VYRFTLVTLLSPLQLLLFSSNSLSDFVIRVSKSEGKSLSGRMDAKAKSIEEAIGLAKSFCNDPSREGDSIAILLEDEEYRIAKTIVLDHSIGLRKNQRLRLIGIHPKGTRLVGSVSSATHWVSAKDDTSLSDSLGTSKASIYRLDLDKLDITQEPKAIFRSNELIARAATPFFSPEDRPEDQKDKSLSRHLWLPKEIRVAPEDLKHADLFIVPFHPWITNLLEIDDYDDNSKRVRTKRQATYEMRKVNPSQANFFRTTARLENTPSGLSERSRWCLLSSPPRLFVSTDDPTWLDAIEIPVITELIKVEGELASDAGNDNPISGISIERIEFGKANFLQPTRIERGWGLQHDWEMYDSPSAMVRFRGAVDCGVKNCKFQHSGAMGIRCDLFCQRIVIDRCQFKNLGGGGVLFAGYGMGTRDVNRENQVTNCIFEDIGKIAWHAVPIWAWQSGGNTIEHNRISNVPYSGIVVTGRTVLDRSGNGEASRTVRWSELPFASEKPNEKVVRIAWDVREPFMHSRNNRVEFNDISQCMQRLGDGNAIYISGAGGGNVVSNNWIHDIDSSNINASIRCDDDQNDVLIQSNLVEHVTGEAFVLKGRNKVINNFFVDIRSKTSKGEKLIRSRGYMVFSGAPITGSEISKNIFYCLDPILPVVSERKANAKDPTSAELAGSKLSKNIYYHPKNPHWGSGYLFEQRRKDKGMEKDSLATSPGFRDAAKGDYSFLPNASAKKLGIQEIDVSQAGPTKKP
jgi:hypothetical protein